MMKTNSMVIYIKPVKNDWEYYDKYTDKWRPIRTSDLPRYIKQLVYQGYEVRAVHPYGDR